MFFNNRGFTPSNRLRDAFRELHVPFVSPGSLPRHRWPSANMQIVSDTRYAGSIHRSPTSWCRSIIISEAYNGSRLDRPYSNGTQRIYRHTPLQLVDKTISTTIPSQLIRAAHRQINQRSIIVPSPGNCRVSRLGCSYSVAHYRCAFHSGIRPVCHSIVGRTTYFGFLCQPIGPAQSGYDYDRHDDGLIASKATYVGYNL